MWIEFDDGTLLLSDAPEDIPYGEWDDRVVRFLRNRTSRA